MNQFFTSHQMTYSEAGVNTEAEEIGLRLLLKWVNKTLGLRTGLGAPALDTQEISSFANVIDIGHGLGLAMSTDGVGTKIIVARMLNKYDTIGIDCVAMNVNDVLCVGAEPLSMLDYIAVQELDPSVLEEIGKGLYEGAKRAGITIAGGEIAQIGEIVNGLDLAGMCVGMVPLDKIVVGRDIDEGDVVIGLRSSGIHSNGLTLARKIFFDRMKMRADQYVPELKRPIGEELLEPTHIYVPEVMEMIRSGLTIKALVHITGDGLLNLFRVKSEVGYIIDSLPEVPPIFSLIQRSGHVSDEEMFRVYNMGIGFCIIAPPSEVESVISAAHKYGTHAYKIGSAVKDTKGKVFIPSRHLVGVKEEGRFSKN